MSATALVMAGGAGVRMSATVGQDLPKPLVQVRGVSMLERNVWALVGAGLREVWVACRATQRDILDEISRLEPRLGVRGVTLQALVEPVPLGTIGASALLRGRTATLLSVNADNLTAIDLGAMIARHRETGADLTLAGHLHRIRIPYGELRTDGDRVTTYREKPISTTRVCSAVCVLGPAALSAIDGPTGLHDLAGRLIDTGRDVRVFEHDAAWIDVNDATDLARAEELVASTDLLECWAASPDQEVVGALVRDGARLLLERRADVELWDTPGGKLEAGESAPEALARELREELGIVADDGAPIGRFDIAELDGRIVRHHVFELSVTAAEVSPCEGQVLEWFDASALPVPRAPVVSRSLACATGHRVGRGQP
jgi:NDP-sugar pyrophosphorylase family protein